MSSFSTKTYIDAPSKRVWEALGDIGNIYLWNPGVKNSHLTSDIKQGTGTTRYCDLGSGNYLDESVVLWEPGEALTMRVMDTNMPFKSADIRFTLQAENGGTVVEVSPVYELKYGPIGALMDRFFVQKTYQRGMQSLLRGLKEYLEETKE